MSVSSPLVFLRRHAGTIAAVWGLLAIVGMLVEAILRLAPRAMLVFEVPLTTSQLVILVGIIGFFAGVEGYGGFQRSFSPRAAGRAALLMRDGHRAAPWRLVGAPLFLMSLVGARQKRLIVNWCLFFGIFAMILLVMKLPEPWRAMIDAGVVVGLSWGVLATTYFGAQALAGHAPDVDLELAEDSVAEVSTSPIP